MSTEKQAAAENQIAELRSRGFSRAEIAAKLGLTSHAIREIVTGHRKQRDNG